MLSVYTTARCTVSTEPLDCEVVAEVLLDDNGRRYIQYECGAVEVPMGDYYLVFTSVNSEAPLNPPLGITILREEEKQPSGTLAMEMPDGTVAVIRALRSNEYGTGSGPDVSEKSN